MRSSSAKAKGRRLQDWVVTWLRDLFGFKPEDCKPAIMGETGEDVKLASSSRERFPYSVECKNVEKLNIWSALEQCEQNAPADTQPVVFFRRNRSKTYAVVEASHFMTLAYYMDQHNHCDQPHG
jgi:hypothetical protein